MSVRILTIVNPYEMPNALDTPETAGAKMNAIRRRTFEFVCLVQTVREVSVCVL